MRPRTLAVLGWVRRGLGGANFGGAMVARQVQPSSLAPMRPASASAPSGVEGNQKETHLAVAQETGTKMEPW